jgi:SAM-dependent methyltransferase
VAETGHSGFLRSGAKDPVLYSSTFPPKVRMTFYEKHCLPHLIHFACGLQPIARQRRKVVPLAAGRVLEVGMGGALNLPFFDPQKVELIWGLEPSEGMRRLARKNLRRSPIAVNWISLPAGEIPLEDECVDTVLLTFTLCTIPDWRAALRQMRRVLKPEGKLVFCEHGAAPDATVRKWQTRLTPGWKKIAGGCHLDRPIPEYIEAGGFRITEMEAAYLRGVPRIAGFNTWGTAHKD